MKKIILFLIWACLLAGSAIGAPLHQMASGFSAPVGMAYDRNGRLHIAEWGAGRIVVLDADGKRQTLVSGIKAPAGLCFDDNGRLYIAGYGDGKIHVLEPSASSTLVLAAGVSQPTGLFHTKDNTLLLANRGAGEIVEIWPDGRAKVISRGHNLPVGAVRTENGNLFISCYGGTLDYVDMEGNRKSMRSGLVSPGVGLAPAGKNSVFMVDNGAGSVYLADEHGLRKQLATGLQQPVGLAVTPDGNLAVGSWGDGTINTVGIK